MHIIVIMSNKGAVTCTVCQVTGDSKINSLNPSAAETEIHNINHVSELG